MRLGGYFVAEKMDELEALCEKLDIYGISAIPAPNRLAEMSPDECYAFGQQARQ